MGQNGSQCGCTGVKHDQTAQLNRGIIVPKLCVREGDGGRGRLWVALLSCLVTHTLDNAGSVSFPLWLKHSLMHILDAWTFAPGPHALQPERKKKDLCVPNHDIRTALSKSCPLFEFVQLLRNETQTYMMWLAAFLGVKGTVHPRMEDSAVIYSNDSIQKSPDPK